MPFSSTRLWAALVAGSLLLPGAAFAQAKKPAPAPAHPAAAAPAPAAPAESTPAPAPGQQPQGPIKVDLIATQNTWTKVCGKEPTAGKEICYTTRDFGVKPEEQPILAVAVYDIKGEDTRSMRLLLPIGLLLQPGFRFAIDKGAALEGAYQICIPNGCFGDAKIKGPTVDSLKKGTTLVVSVKNQANNIVEFNIPLAGFGDAFDGPAIDPKVLEEQQKKLQEELQKRAEEERKRLEAAQPPSAGGATLPAGTPAPAAPKP